MCHCWYHLGVIQLIEEANGFQYYSIYYKKNLQYKNPDPKDSFRFFERSKKKGTKEGCAEGGCGACSGFGELKNKKLIYKSINSCISFLPTIDKKHNVIENLSLKIINYISTRSDG